MFLSKDDTLYQHDNLRFSTTDLNSALFHPLDIEKFESDHPELFPQAPMAQARKQIAELERQLQELRHENERLNAGVSEVDSAAPDCAACKADSQHSDEWAKDVECAVSLTARLMAKGERGSTAYHEAEWKALRGGTRKRAFEAFRRALPPDLKEADPKQK